MPSVFTIEGPGPASKAKAAIGDCKEVHNPRTGCSMQLCFVGKSAKCRSGWKFKKGSSRCKGR